MTRPGKLLPLLFFFLCSLYTLQAQQDVLSAGGDISAPAGTLSYSVGQLMYTNFTGESGSISLGVQQPAVFTIVGTEDLEVSLGATLFPNPAKESVNLQLATDLTSLESDRLAIRLYDVTGQLIYQQDIRDLITSLPLTQLSENMYLLQVCRNQAPIKTFKLFKSN